MATTEQEEEAIRLKALAESKFKITKNPKQALKYAKKAQLLSPNLQGISETVTSLNILCAPDIYGVLNVDPFANTNTIRKQYNNLTSLLKPHHVTSSKEAFKLVEEAFNILSDKTLRKEYDAKLQERTFWTSCSTCRGLHQFERRYVGHILLCPGCNKSFKGVENVQNDVCFDEGEDEKTLGEFVLSKKKSKEKVGCEKVGDFKGNDDVGVVGRLRKKMRSVGEVLESSKSENFGTGEGEKMMLMIRSGLVQEDEEMLFPGRRRRHGSEKKVEESFPKSCPKLTKGLTVGNLYLRGSF